MPAVQFVALLRDVFPPATVFYPVNGVSRQTNDSGDLRIFLAISCHSPDEADVVFRDFGSVVAGPVDGFVSSGKGVAVVVRSGHVFEVLYPIVQFVSVLVVDLFAWWGIRNKCSGDDLVPKDAGPYSIFRQAVNAIPTRGNSSFKHPAKIAFSA